MPWFPDFISAVELVRRETREAGQADPVAEYLAALSAGDAKRLETVWPGEVQIFDPRAGEVAGHRQLRQFVHRNMAWLREHQVRVEVVATTTVPGRAAVELLAHIGVDGARAWPVAVVAESPDDSSVIFRTYCSQEPVDGRRHVRPPILAAGADLPADIVRRHYAALAAGDVEALIATFQPDGYYREPVGERPVHRGAAELRSLFAAWFDAGNVAVNADGDERATGIDRQTCAVTDDAVRCAVEYNVLRWGSAKLPPQAGLAVYERGATGLLAAVRVYDDIEPPS